MSLVDRLAASPSFAALSADQLAVVAACATPATFDRHEALFRSGDDAEALHVVETGCVALEVQAAAGAPLLIKTIHPGDVVGLSWMLPPYRWTLDAFAVDATTTIRIESQCLRDACEADHELGYALHQAFAGLIRERLVATRMQLLDVYGNQSQSNDLAGDRSV